MLAGMTCEGEVAAVRTTGFVESGPVGAGQEVIQQTVTDRGDRVMIFQLGEDLVRDLRMKGMGVNVDEHGYYFARSGMACKRLF